MHIMLLPPNARIEPSSPSLHKDLTRKPSTPHLIRILTTFHCSRPRNYQNTTTRTRILLSNQRIICNRNLPRPRRQLPFPFPSILQNDTQPPPASQPQSIVNPFTSPFPSYPPLHQQSPDGQEAIKITKRKNRYIAIIASCISSRPNKQEHSKPGHKKRTST
ncbi:hypothetical protein B0O99DRAFT_633647 [Bisporella sp. PMI_857]|nr:hypothetical protein B0O99DRAFT_633647 [Bisporella sp. PMI_857]